MEFHRYVSGIAEARYAIRKVFRIADEQARAAGLEPLEHQALLQVYGSSDQMLQVSPLAGRLDIAPAFASRVVRQLEDKGYVKRHSSESDRRVTEVRITDAGRAIVQAIDADVRVHVEYFQKQLSPTSKSSALFIVGFYVGVDLPQDMIDNVVFGQPRTGAS